MKKIIVGISGILIAAFVVILFVNAQNSTQEGKKASTEVSMNCGNCPSAAGCAKMAEAKASEVKACDPAKCKEAGCDPAKCKEGKCDPATCKVKCATTAACPGSAKK